MINQIEVASRSRQNVTHKLYLDEQGKAIGCSCEFRQWHQWTPCRHMEEYNAAAEGIREIDAYRAKQEDDLHSEYEGCDFCGRNHKSWNCPF